MTLGHVLMALRARVRRLTPTRHPWARGIHDPRGRAILSELEKSTKLPPLQRRGRRTGTIWAVSLVKNEADIIEPVMQHLFKQGVDAALVLDNGSSDETLKRLEVLARDLPIHIGRDLSAAHHQGLKMSMLANAARKAGADWILPVDGDEFWFAQGGTLRDFLSECRADVVRAPVDNLFPVDGVSFGDGAWRLEPALGWLKVAFRSHRRARVADGNHAVVRPGVTVDAGLRVLHVPWRSYEQFRRKARQGSAALDQAGAPPTVGWHWRHIASLNDDSARRVWRRMLDGEEVPEIGWSPSGSGTILVDPTEWDRWDPGGVTSRN